MQVLSDARSFIGYPRPADQDVETCLDERQRLCRRKELLGIAISRLEDHRPGFVGSTVVDSMLALFTTLLSFSVMCSVFACCAVSVMGKPDPV